MVMARISGACLRGVAVGLTLVAGSAAAHSLKDVEDALAQREEYFQVVNKPAPEFLLQDSNGVRSRLTSYAGKVVVLNFIYASCNDVCPLHSERIAEIQDMVNRTPMKDLVEFISVTTDPNNDTPGVLARYGESHGLEHSNWRFLTKTPDQDEASTRRLAEAYGHRFTPVDGQYQAHGIVTHIIDKGGQWRANFYGLKFSPVNMVLFINALTNDTHAREALKPEDGGLWSYIRKWF
jgi:protein SCO1/2